MGLFNKSKSDQQRMLSKQKLESMRIMQATSGSSSIDENDHSPVTKVKNGKKKSTPLKTKFWRLNDVQSNEQPTYIPPSTFVGLADPFAQQNTTFDTPASSLRQNGANRKKYQSRAFHRLDSMDDSSMQEMVREAKGDVPRLKPPSIRKKLSPVRENSVLVERKSSTKKKKPGKLKVGSSSDSSTCGIYQPPLFPVDSDRSTHSATKGAAFQGFMRNVINNSFSSEDTFDVRSHQSKDECEQWSISDNRSHHSGLFSANGFPTASGGHDFRQIVFDNTCHTVEKVTVKNTDSKASDLVDFFHCTSHPDNNPAKEKSHHIEKLFDNSVTASRHQPVHTVTAKKKHPSVWPKLNDCKRDTPGYTTTTTASCIQKDEVEHFSQSLVQEDLCVSIAPSSLPSHRLRKYDGLRTVSDGFSVASSLSDKNRQEVQRKVKSKLRTPPRLHLQEGSVISVETDKDSLARSAYSKPLDTVPRFLQTQSMDPFFRSDTGFGVNNVANDDIDPFGIGETVRQTDDAAWNTSFDPFQKRHQNVSLDIQSERIDASEVVHSVSMDEGLIASIRKASTNKHRADPETHSLKRDPSPRRELKLSCSDGVLEYAESNPMGPQKLPPKSVPTNAILGSMLFRQTEVTQCGSQAMKSEMDRSKNVGSSLLKDMNPQGDADVPLAVTADGMSVISSVTEEASSFYENKFGHWNKQAMNVLKNYNVKKTLLSSNSSTAEKCKASRNHGRVYPVLSRLEEEHVNLFRSEV